MKNYSASLLVLAFAELVGISAVSSAWAAAPGYCALYAREYVRAAAGVPLVRDDVPDGLSRLENRAYYRCLNLDEAPELPSASIYYRPDAATEAALGSEFQAMPTEEAAKPSAAPKIPKVAKQKTKRKPVRSARRHGAPTSDIKPATTIDTDGALSSEKRRGISVVRLLNCVATLLQGSNGSNTRRSSVADATPAPIPPMKISPKVANSINACRNSPYMIARCSTN